MSLLPYYKKRVTIKSAEVSAAGTTITLWTPSTGTRISLESLHVANSSGASGTVAIYFGGDSLTLAPTRVVITNLSASTSINVPTYGATGRQDSELLRVNASVVPCSVTAFGFELE